MGDSHRVVASLEQPEVLPVMALARRDIADGRMTMFVVVPVHEAREPPTGMVEVLEAGWIAGGVLHRFEK